MPFFQNPFNKEFRGTWVLGDRQHSPDFVIYGHAGRQDEVVVCFNAPPYDLSGNDLNGDSHANLKFAISLWNDKNWGTISVDVATGAVSTSAVTAEEIVAKLIATAAFNDFFEARLVQFNDGSSRIAIRQRKSISEVRFYVINGQAEAVLGFNKRAGIAELPSYFKRHSVENRYNYADSQNCLIQLSKEIESASVANPTVITCTGHGLKSGDVITVVGSNTTPTINGDRTVTYVTDNTFTIPVNVSVAGTKGYFAKKEDAALIANAMDARGNPQNLALASVQEDYQLLRGRSGLFNFQKITVDANGGQDRILQIIEYPAGSKAGDLGRKIIYTYTSTQTHPDTITEIPYTIRSGDLLTP